MLNITWSRVSAVSALAGNCYIRCDHKLDRILYPDRMHDHRAVRSSRRHNLVSHHSIGQSVDICTRVGRRRNKLLLEIVALNSPLLQAYSYLSTLKVGIKNLFLDISFVVQYNDAIYSIAYLTVKEMTKKLHPKYMEERLKN